jgi:hypothetical protein
MSCIIWCPSKHMATCIMLCMFIVNHLAIAAPGWKSPEQVLTGQRPDISKFLHFSFYEPVYYHAYSDNFTSTSNEEQGWWVGIATHVTDALTYKVFTKHNKIMYRSALRSALDTAKHNQCLSPLGGRRHPPTLVEQCVSDLSLHLIHSQT